MDSVYAALQRLTVAKGPACPYFDPIIEGTSLRTIPYFFLPVFVFLRESSDT